ncbi:MAG: hypothetical protein ACPGUZ_00495 [Holosporaceae bacterium]
MLACLFHHTAWAQESHHVVPMPDIPSTNAPKAGLFEAAKEKALHLVERKAKEYKDTCKAELKKRALTQAKQYVKAVAEEAEKQQKETARAVQKHHADNADTMAAKKGAAAGATVTLCAIAGCASVGPHVIPFVTTLTTGIETASVLYKSFQKVKGFLNEKQALTWLKKAIDKLKSDPSFREATLPSFTVTLPEKLAKSLHQSEIKVCEKTDEEGAVAAFCKKHPKTTVALGAAAGSAATLTAVAAYMSIGPYVLPISASVMAAHTAFSKAEKIGKHVLALPTYIRRMQNVLWAVQTTNDIHQSFKEFKYSLSHPKEALKQSLGMKEATKKGV